MPRPLTVFFAALLGFVALFPYRHDLGLYSSETDGVLWILRGAPWNPKLWDWVGSENHFVGWRPLTALSFTANSALAGPAYPPGIYRWTDTLLHLLAAFLVVPAGRAVGLGPRSAWVAALVFAAHPAAAEVVPYLSRRSYTLCVVFSLVATLAHQRALRGGAGWGLLAALLTGLAITANELAYLLVPWFFLLGLAPGVSRVRAGLVWAGEVVAWAGLFRARYAVVGKVGGYEFDDAGPERSFRVAREAIEFLWVPTSTWGSPGWVDHPAFVAAWVGSVLGVVALAVADRRPEGAWRPLLLLLGHLALYAWTGAWFFRMGYVPGVALAWLLVGVTERAWAWGGRWRWALLAPGLALGWILSHSPALVGVEPHALEFRRARHAQITALKEDFEALPERAVVFLVAPHAQLRESNPLWNSDARYAMKYLTTWGLAFGEKRRLEVRPLAWVIPGPAGGWAPEATPNGIRFPARVDVWTWPARARDRRRREEPWEVPFAELRRVAGKRPAFVYFAAGLSRELVPVP